MRLLEGDNHYTTISWAWGVWVGGWVGGWVVVRMCGPQHQKISKRKLTKQIWFLNPLTPSPQKKTKKTRYRCVVSKRIPYLAFC